jgi:predicted nucleic-acid-binding protein
MDCNVLLHHLAQDDPVQSPKATRFIEHTLSAETPGYVSLVVIAEIARVLERSYGLSGAQLAAVIERMLHIVSLVVEADQAVFSAVVALRQNRAPFAAALMGALHARAGCTATVTFDRHAAQSPDFQLL